MNLLPMGAEGDFCVITQGAGVSLLATGAKDGITDDDLDRGITIDLTPEAATLLGEALIQAGRARSN